MPEPANPAPTVAPAAPAAPEAAPAPQAPAAGDPAASVQPGAPTQQPSTLTQPSPDAAAKADDDEWDAAAREQYPDHKFDKQEPGKDGKPKPKEGEQAKKEGEPNSEKKEPDEAAGASDGTEGEGKTDRAADTRTPADAEREARAAARESAKQLEAVTTDIREKMYPDLKPHLTDADGDPIKSIEDVMKLINPNTRTPETPQGRTFTEEEAATWLLAAQQQFNQQYAATEKEIERVADLQLTIKAESDYITSKYSEALKDEKLRERIWSQFERTLVRDEKSGIITKMPVSLEEFYEMALEGRANATPAPAAPAAPKAEGEPGAPAQPAAPADPAAEAKAEAERRAAAERQRQQNRADRGDIIYQPPTDVNVNQEDKEWDQAAKDYYGEQYKGK